MTQNYILQTSSRASKKFEIITPEEKKIHFGTSGISDYSNQKNEDRKYNYNKRHATREDWTKKGIKSRFFQSLAFIE